MSSILTKRQPMSSPIDSVDLAASKRGRFDAPCRVLHIGGVPDGCDESEITQMLLQMGVRTPERIVLPPGKVMAFVQFQLQADADHAVAVSREGKVPCLLRGRRVNFNYSGRDDLGSPKTSASAAPPAKVLVVSISNVQYPITIDVIQQVFGHFGLIEKVCIIVKPAAATALVQFSNISDAVNARQNLDGKCIYMHCCQMQIVFSDRGDVIIKRFDILQWDYTDPASSHHLAQYAISPQDYLPIPSVAANMPGGHNFVAHQQAAAMSSHGSHQMRHMMGMGLPSFPSPQYNPQDPFAAGRFPSPHSGHMSGHMSPTGNMSPMSHALQQQAHHQSFGSVGLPPSSLPPRMMQSLPPGMSIPQSQSLGSMAPMMELSGPGRVLHVANINDKSTTVTHLFNLFSLCGCIARIKFVFKNPTTALIEYASAAQAVLSQRALQDVPLHGNPLKLNVSKFPGISIDSRNTPEMAQDFTTLRNHRTRFGPSIPRSAPMPCNVVHATGFPVAYSEANVLEIFSNVGPIDKIVFVEPKKMEGSDVPVNPFSVGRKNAVVHFQNVSDATNALATLHNFEIDGVQVRINFSPGAAKEGAQRALEEQEQHADDAAEAAAGGVAGQ